MNYDTSKSTEPAPDEHDQRDESEKVLTELEQRNEMLRIQVKGLLGEIQQALLRAERAERALLNLRLEVGLVVPE